ncbi:hypothetical protein CAMGR0001_2552 [Campylobacter gracilis RM3268]|uniref:Uncharacterized protein n=1 Tax=Campylobacter gracilis RM3268 TaxID=553220 RepID=C8PER4_9BACT|nr:hypothetical protein CAMGR0001_2552 [Campylobacter gracilis RM3268]
MRPHSATRYKFRLLNYHRFYTIKFRFRADIKPRHKIMRDYL